MQRCSNCNAPLQEDVETCTFCNTVTETGRRLKVERTRREEETARAQAADQRAAEQRAQQQATQEKARLLAESSRAVNRSLMWSLLGLLACCMPFGPIIGIVTARRARELALKNGAGSGHASTAFVVGIAALLFSVGGWGGIGWIAKIEADRKAELRALIAKSDGDATLSLATACAMAELEVLTQSYHGYNHLNDDLACGARLEVDVDEATLLDAHFTKDQIRVPVVACFHRVANRWAISQVRPDERCDLPAPAPVKDAAGKQKRNR